MLLYPRQCIKHNKWLIDTHPMIVCLSMIPLYLWAVQMNLLVHLPCSFPSPVAQNMCACVWMSSSVSKHTDTLFRTCGFSICRKKTGSIFSQFFLFLGFVGAITLFSPSDVLCLLLPAWREIEWRNGHFSATWALHTLSFQGRQNDAVYFSALPPTRRKRQMQRFKIQGGRKKGISVSFEMHLP